MLTIELLLLYGKIIFCVDWQTQKDIISDIAV